MLSCDKTGVPARNPSITVELYVTPVPNSNCGGSKWDDCDGTFAKPFDKLAMAFAYLEEIKKIGDNKEATVTINLMKGTVAYPYHFLLDALKNDANVTTYSFRMYDEDSDINKPFFDPTNLRVFERTSVTAII